VQSNSAAGTRPKAANHAATEPGASSATGVALVIAVKRLDAAKTRLSPTFTIALARNMLHGTIDHIQTSWVKLGVERTQVMLNGGANDLGGTLMEETISRMAGSSYGSYKSVRDIQAIASAAGRPTRQRTTTYGAAAEERVAVGERFDGHLPELLPVLEN